MPNFVRSLQNIEENHRIISSYFHIVIYSFDNSLFYGCIYASETDDWKLIYASLLSERTLGVEISRIISTK